MPRSPHHDGRSTDRAKGDLVVLLYEHGRWPAPFLDQLAAEGYRPLGLDDVDELPSVVQGGSVGAVIVGARALGARDLLVLRECRAAFPQTAVVVLDTADSPPELKRAFESGATAFLSWPAPPQALREALRSGRR